MEDSSDPCSARLLKVIFEVVSLSIPGSTVQRHHLKKRVQKSEVKLEVCLFFREA